MITLIRMDKMKRKRIKQHCHTKPLLSEPTIKELSMELTEEQVYYLTEKVLVGTTLIYENAEQVLKSRFCDSGTRKELSMLHNLARKVTERFYAHEGMRSDETSKEFNRMIAHYENQVTTNII